MNRTFTIKDLDKLKKIGVKGPAYQHHYQKVVDAYQLFDFINTPSRDKLNYKKEAYKNCMVSFASATEVLCKELIINFEHKWNPKGYSELLKHTLSLDDAYTLFKTAKVKRSSIVVHYYTFLSLEKICTVFGALTQRRSAFLDDVENFSINNSTPFGTMFPAWRTLLNEIFTTRNQIVHENYVSFKIDPDKVFNYYIFSLLFGVALHNYVEYTEFL